MVEWFASMQGELDAHNFGIDQQRVNLGINRQEAA